MWAQPFLYSVQSESLVALEAAKAAEKSVLDEQVRSSQETLQEKLKELSALQQQNVKVEWVETIVCAGFWAMTEFATASARCSLGRDVWVRDLVGSLLMWCRAGYFTQQCLSRSRSRLFEGWIRLSVGSLSLRWKALHDFVNPYPLDCDLFAG